MTSPRQELQTLTNPAIWLCALAAAFTFGTARAATNSPDNVSVPANAESMTPKQAYEHDKAYCNSSQVTEARATCLKEAARAYQEARAGKLETGTVAASGTSSYSSDQSSSSNATSTSGTTAPARRTDRN